MASNWFDQGGKRYARFRPEYPHALSDFLARIAPAHRLAVDVGCGTGQLTLHLARAFDAVTGLDPSQDQIANAAHQANVRYICAPAEKLPLPDTCADLITAAQAAHWFDLPAFYAEARRIAVRGGVLALISYGVLVLDEKLRERFTRFYYDEIGPFWPPERKLVDSGYAGIDFPFDPIEPPRMEIRKDWDLEQTLGYISTWSAVRRAREAGREELLKNFADDLAALWGDAAQTRAVAWPINMRVGRL